MESFEAKKFELTESEKETLVKCQEKLRFLWDAVSDGSLSYADLEKVNKRQVDFVRRLEAEGKDPKKVYMVHVLSGSTVNAEHGVDKFDLPDGEIVNFILEEMLKGIEVRSSK